MTKHTIVRNYVHRTFGDIGRVELVGDVSAMTLDGKALPDDSVEYLLRFALQSLQDAYAGAKTEAEARGNWGKRLDNLLAGTMGSRGGGGTDGTLSLALLRLYRAAMTKDTLKRFNALEAEKQLELATANVTDETAIAKEVAKIEAERDARRKDAEARKGLVAELAKGMSFDF